MSEQRGEDQTIGQNVRDFTVQIRRIVDGEVGEEQHIVGTGFVVSTDGKIVTCAHVVSSALGLHPRQAGDTPIGVYFPQRNVEKERRKRRAVVVACFEHTDDDVVLLQLADGPCPLAPDQIAQLGAADASVGHPFQSYGYRRLAHYLAGRADGKILGDVERPLDRTVLADPIELKSGEINLGMSGAAVLDTRRNLVVGVISETWFPDRSGKDSETAWAVDARVLSLDPLRLHLEATDVPRRPAPQSPADPAVAHRLAIPAPGINLSRAPQPLQEWVGRADLLEAITHDYLSPHLCLTGLIGFGGEGKSSLARRWLDETLNNPTLPQPDGVFWWGFYENRDVDQFFEAVLAYMTGGAVNPADFPSSAARAAIAGAMLHWQRYLFVLDGLEVMQHQHGDDYGLLISADLRDFIRYFAAPGHPSFCLVTSRAPLLDLIAYSTYSHRSVDRLSPLDGRALLRQLGVHGPDPALDHVVGTWDGHALTLSLIAGLLVEQYGGDVRHVDEIPLPTANEDRYQRVARVLRRYDDHLSDPERAFLMLFSLFRTPVPPSSFPKVFRAAQYLSSAEQLEADVLEQLMGRPVEQRLDPEAVNAPLVELGDAEFNALVARLVAYRMLRFNQAEGHYTTHPLIRSHYYARLLARGQQAQESHRRAANYYLDSARSLPETPTLDELVPLIEAVYHLCQAGAYDEAENIRWSRIDQESRSLITYVLGAWDTQLALLLEFFPGRDPLQDPYVTTARDKAFLINGVANCLQALGRLAEAKPLYPKVIALSLAEESWVDCCIAHGNLAELHIASGAFAEAEEASQEALRLSSLITDEKRRLQRERNSVAALGWIAHLLGNLTEASEYFQRAESLERAVSPREKYLYSKRGENHAEHLRRIGDHEYARRVIDANLITCADWPDDLSHSYRILGELEAAAGDDESARQQYNKALELARGITLRPVLIEALTARGRWAARRGDPAAARSDLAEALDYAVSGGFRVYEADIRVALAWMHLADGNPTAARAEAEHALTMSDGMGYYWGKVDAQEVLDRI